MSLVGASSTVTTSIAIFVPVFVALVTGIFGYATVHGGRVRENRIGEIAEAFEERGKLVDALRESRDELTKKVSDLEAKVELTERKRQADMRHCREQINALKREIRGTR